MMSNKSKPKVRGSRSKEGTPGGYNVNTFLNLFGLFIVIICVFSVGFLSGKIWGGEEERSEIFEVIGRKENPEVTELNFALFWDVWSTLQDYYVEKDISEQDMYYGAIKGMVDGIGDPVTIFLTSEETNEYKKGNQGKFEGIGAELGYEGGSIVVVAPLEGSPAIEAGLRSGDRIFKVDGEDITSKNIFKVVSMIRGEQGTEVVLSVLHKGDFEAVDVNITRGEITVPSIDYEVKNDGEYIVIDVDRFTEVSAAAWQNQWDETVSDVLAENPKGIILDLRGNPGGYFSSAVWAAGEFLESGSVVSKQQDRDKRTNDFIVQRDGRLLDIPVVVLVDGGSASASEILAGALKYYDRVYIIGEETYGKGTAQEIIDFSDGSSMHITTLKWLLPDDSWLNPENVIEPDKVVELTTDDFTNGDDPQMKAAIDYLNSKIGSR